MILYILHYHSHNRPAHQRLPIPLVVTGGIERSKKENLRRRYHAVNIRRSTCSKSWSIFFFFPWIVTGGPSTHTSHFQPLNVVFGHNNARLLVLVKDLKAPTSPGRSRVANRGGCTELELSSYRGHRAFQTTLNLKIPFFCQYYRSWPKIRYSCEVDSERGPSATHSART